MVNSQERDRGRSRHEKSRSREKDRKDKKHDRKEKKDKDRSSPSRKHKDRSPSRRDSDRRRSRSRSRDRSARDRGSDRERGSDKGRRRSRERSRSRSGGRKRRREETTSAAGSSAAGGGAAPPPVVPMNPIVAAALAQMGLAPGQMVAPQAPAATSAVPSGSTAATGATGAPASSTENSELFNVNAEALAAQRRERVRQEQLARRQGQSAPSSAPFVFPSSKKWSLEEDDEDEESGMSSGMSSAAQEKAVAEAAAIAAQIRRTLTDTPVEQQKDKGTPGYMERMDVAMSEDGLDPLDAFMTTLETEGNVVATTTSIYGALGAGDDVMSAAAQNNGRRFDPVGSMVIGPDDLGDGGKAAWESDAESGTDDGDDEAEAKRTREWLAMMRAKQNNDLGSKEVAMDVDDKESVISGGDVKKPREAQLGRIFGSEGDVMEEEERIKQEHKAEAVLQDAIKKKELKEVDHSKIDYLPFKKKLYVLPKAHGAMKPEEVTQRREALEIKVRGKGCPPPMDTWGPAGLSDRVQALLNKFDMKEPFAIQKQAIPAILAGRDIIGVAKTGSGKTLAFLLPLFRHIMVQEAEHPLREGEGPIGLIMAPARELVNQIYKEAKRFSKGLGLRVTAVYGGAGVADQIGELKRGAHIVVCTPGRMIDILTMQAGKVFSLQRVSYVVLDEADRMFDMGFEPQIRMIINNVRPDRQTVLFSATFPKQVEGLARKVLKYPLEIIVGGRSVASADIKQYVEIHEDSEKMLRLLQLLGLWYEQGNVLIFVDTQSKCDSLFHDLVKSGYPCSSLHGGMEQMDRDSTINDFKKKITTLMVATSVAGRGLDVPELVCVINYNCPNHLEDYVHRVGRTGRAGRKGTAYTFLEPTEEQFAPFMIKALEGSKQEVPEELRVMAKSFEEKLKTGEAKKISSGYGGSGFKFDETEMTAEQKAEAAAKRQYELESGIAVEDVGEASGDEEEAGAPAAAPAVALPLPTPVAPVIPAVPVPAPAPAPIAPPPVVEPPANIHPSIAAALKQMQDAGIAPAPPPAAPAPGGPAPETVLKLAELKAKLEAQAGISSAPAAPSTSGLGMGMSITPAQPTQAPPASIEEAKRRAAEVAARIAGVIPAAKVEEAKHFSDELEINDFPQQARWKVTHRETMNAINELTGCAIISRGQYFPPGKEPEPGSTIKKLYLFIEGDSEVAVSSARRELLRIVNEEMARVGNRPGGGGFSGGKYSVV